MLNKYAKNHTVKEYLFIIFGIIISFFVNFILDYTFEVSKNYQNHSYKFSGNSYIVSLIYLISTGYFISLICPIVSVYRKNFYKNLFYLISTTNILWFITLISTGGLSIILDIVKISICMPITYLFAWRINSQYWLSKQVGISQ